jgi:ribonuclease VapC
METMASAPEPTAATRAAPGVIDLVVDTSAVIAVLLGEQPAAAIVKQLHAAQQPAVAAPTRTEILLVALVKLGEAGRLLAERFLEQQQILTVSWDQSLADAAVDAFQRFGRGRHPAALNFGDCFSYALARHQRVPLLFIGDDFNRTDLGGSPYTSMPQ